MSINGASTGFYSRNVFAHATKAVKENFQVRWAAAYLPGITILGEVLVACLATLFHPF